MRSLILLAAGKGERLRPLTETRPKPLMPVVDETILCRHLRLATKSYSPDEIIVVASYMIDDIRRHVRDCGFEAMVINQEGERGTGDAINKALASSSGDEFLIIYSDIYIEAIVYEAIASSETPSILAVPVDKPWEYGVLETLEDTYMKRIVEKPPRGKEPSNLIFAGMIKLGREHARYFERIPLSPRNEYEATDGLTMLAQDYPVRIVKVVDKGQWLDIGRPWDLLEANRLALASKAGQTRIQGEIHPTAVVEGPVIVEEGAVIKPFTVVEGPAYIGRGAVVGPHAYIRGWGVLRDGSKVGHSTEFKASILFEDAKAPHLNYIGDSIVGEHVNLGAGTITANLRFDKKTIKMNIKNIRVDTGRSKLGAVIGGYAQTGINVSIYPGVKIGSHALVYPGCVVKRDVEKNGVVKCS